MLSRVVGLSASGLLELRPRSVLKTNFWLQNDPQRSSILGTNRQAAISTSTKRKVYKALVKKGRFACIGHYIGYGGRNGLMKSLGSK
jgi:hypothetical protein